MQHQILQQFVPTAQEIANWEFFSCLMGGTFIVLYLASLFMEWALNRAEARLIQRDADAAEDAYYRQSLEAASTIGRPWPPAREGRR